MEYQVAEKYPEAIECHRNALEIVQEIAKDGGQAYVELIPQIRGVISELVGKLNQGVEVA